MNWNGNETKSFAGNFVASGKGRLFFEVPKRHDELSPISKMPSEPHAGSRYRHDQDSRSARRRCRNGAAHRPSDVNTLCRAKPAARA